MATDLKKLFFSDRATESTYDLDLSLKNWQMKIKWQNSNVELAAIARLRDILFGYYRSYDNIPADRQHKICEIIYTKLTEIISSLKIS